MINKKLIEVALPLDKINTEAGRKNLFDMDTHPLCIFGGQDVL